MIYRRHIFPMDFKRRGDDAVHLASKQTPPHTKFMAEISETETIFLDTNIYKGERFRSNSVLDVRTHFKPTETFQYTHFSSCHPRRLKKGFLKTEALTIRTNSSKQNYLNIKSRLRERGYFENLVQRTLLEVHFENRKLAFLHCMKNRNRTNGSRLALHNTTQQFQT